jgi:hypothetical protein
MQRTFVRLVLLAAFSFFVSSLPRVAQASSAPLEFAPADTMAIVHLDVDRVRKAPIFKEIEAEIRRDEHAKRDLEKVKAEVGVDLLKDLAGATLFLGPNAMKDDRDLVAVFEGKYNEAKLVAFLTKQSEKHAHEAPGVKDGPGGKLYLLEHGKVAVAFRGKRIVVGGVAMVARALAKNDPKAVLANVRKPVEGDMIWLAAAPTSDVQSRLSMIGADTLESLSLGIQASDGAKLQAHARFGDPAQAAALAKEANDALAKAQNDSMVKQLGVGELLQKVVVAANGANLDVTIEWTKMQVETLQKAVSPFLR